MVSAHEVELKEGWFDMKIGKALKAFSPIAMAGKALGIRELGGMSKSGSTGDGRLIQQMIKDGKIPTALEEGKARIAAGPVVAQMKKGGMVKKGYHKMPDGRMMKDSAHKKMAKKSTASKRADGICKKGKTKGRMC